MFEVDSTISGMNPRSKKPARVAAQEATEDIMTVAPVASWRLGVEFFDSEDLGGNNSTPRRQGQKPHDNLALTQRDGG